MKNTHIRAQMGTEMQVFYVRSKHRAVLEQADAVGKITECGGSSMQAVT
ncbi:hypothetical protein cg0440 [Corynebacterium glutamicum ATCC 13032]|nr:hypothetical protein cg0440 [Corynebacterium glutamicum ATCC 13032]